jgi:hypothetical protein
MAFGEVLPRKGALRAVGPSFCGSARRSGPRSSTYRRPARHRGRAESPLGNPSGPRGIAEAAATTAMRVEGPIESRRSALDARVASGGRSGGDGG